MQTLSSLLKGGMLAATALILAATPARAGAIQFRPGATSWHNQQYIGANQSDHYTFAATAGQDATISVNSPGQDTVLAIVSPSGEPIATGQMSGQTSWQGQLPESGTYQLDVIDQGPATNYGLNVSIDPIHLPILGPGPVAIQPQHVHHRGDIHFQPGATAASVQGFLGSDSSDYYTFEADQGQPADISVASLNGKGDLTLIAPNGQVLSSAQYGMSAWHGTLPATGTYRANVRNANDAEVGYYTLHLDIEPG
ncbi:MAG: PPC domain-containing protein [Cyanobacteria bacterium P01_H01_bin.121]